MHALARQAVLDRTAPSRLAVLNAQAGGALERLPRQNALVPRLAHRFLAAQFLGLHEEALRTRARRAGSRSGAWRSRRPRAGSSALPRCPSATRRTGRSCPSPPQRTACGPAASRAAGRSPRSWPPRADQRCGWRRRWVSRTRRGGLASTGPGQRTCSRPRWGREDWDPDDAQQVRALGSLGRALALAGQMSVAREVGSRAIDLARRLDDDETMSHVLNASLWHGTTPDLAEQQLARSAEISRLSRAARDYETLGAASTSGPRPAMCSAGRTTCARRSRTRGALWSTQACLTTGSSSADTPTPWRSCAATSPARNAGPRRP